jgi:hypothetical protein
VVSHNHAYPDSSYQFLARLIKGPSTLFTTARRRISTFSEISARQGLRNKWFGTDQIRL